MIYMKQLLGDLRPLNGNDLILMAVVFLRIHLNLLLIGATFRCHALSEQMTEMMDTLHCYWLLVQCMKLTTLNCKVLLLQHLCMDLITCSSLCLFMILLPFMILFLVLLPPAQSPLSLLYFLNLIPIRWMHAISRTWVMELFKYLIITKWLKTNQMSSKLIFGTSSSSEHEGGSEVELTGFFLAFFAAFYPFFCWQDTQM